MALIARNSRGALVAVATAARSSSIAAEAPPLGCYERVYDAAHLAAHPLQLIVRAVLSVTARAADPGRSVALFSRL
jgi:hypothetical protein